MMFFAIENDKPS